MMPIIKQPGFKKNQVCVFALMVVILSCLMVTGCKSDSSTTGSTDDTSAVIVNEDSNIDTGLTGVIYVDADNASGVEDGKSWAKAYNTVTEALAAAVTGDEIWVAEGKYYPTTTTDRNASFNLIAGVSLYGGFTGNESSVSEQDVETNETILSGDIGVSANNSDNAYHVVVGSDDAVMDGFTIQDGNANLPNDGSGSLVETSLYDAEILRIVTNVKSISGGGLLNVHAATVTRNCTFKNNSAGKGGAVYNMVTKVWNPGGENLIGESPSFENCLFEGNSASGRGGAVNSDFFTTPTYVNCRFINNNCDSKGGAVYIDYGAWPGFTDCLFDANSAAGNGGAVYVDNNSSQLNTIQTWFDTCDFQNNVSEKRGGAFAVYEGTVHFSDSTISNNSAETGGGGIALNYHGAYDTDDTDVTIFGNSSITGDADIYIDASYLMGPP